jgi:hypothetical protein
MFSLTLNESSFEKFEVRAQNFRERRASANQRNSKAMVPIMTWILSGSEGGPCALQTGTPSEVKFPNRFSRGKPVKNSR